MWNYRVVRRKYVGINDADKGARATYTYGIHEAYYDTNDHVGAITKDPVEVLGENIEELRHAWVMMAEAFGQPILDYDTIPEPGYDRRGDPLRPPPVEQFGEMESAEVPAIMREALKRDLEELYGPTDDKECEQQVEEERVEKEKVHYRDFVGTVTLEGLIGKVCSNYRDYRKEEKTRR
jgi:hypothetical protein